MDNIYKLNYSLNIVPFITNKNHKPFNLPLLLVIAHYSKVYLKSNSLNAFESPAC